jgi:predicted sulfurtransferase
LPTQGRKMRDRPRWAFRIVLAFLALSCSLGAASRGEVPRMTKEELKAIMNDPDFVILDVRAGQDWEKSDLKIKGAIRENPQRDTESWAKKYAKDKTIVLYCA